MALIANRTSPRGLRFQLVESLQTPGVTNIKYLSKHIVVKQPIQRMIQGFYDWEKGDLIQNAFPFLSASEREFLMTGIDEGEWDTLFFEDEK